MGESHGILFFIPFYIDLLEYTCVLFLSIFFDVDFMLISETL